MGIFMNYNNFFKVLSYIYLILLTIILLIPLDSIFITNVLSEDKHPSNYSSYFIHFFLFFILSFIFNFSFQRKSFLLVLLLSYSIFIEFFQILFERGFQIFDIFFNIIGILSAYYLYNYFIIK